MSAQDPLEQPKKHSKFRQRFKQQRLPAWQPILTADTVLPAFFLIGLLFIPLGVALIIFSGLVQEKSIDYTTCEDPFFKKPCSEVITEAGYWNQTHRRDCICELNFTIAKMFEKNVYLYYGLDNFYQNHRRYVKSRDDRQLYGKDIEDVDSNCSPFNKEGGKVYAPCGAIANSLFNDTLILFDVTGNKEVDTLNTSIAWPSDKKRKFNNPQGSQDANSDNFNLDNYTIPDGCEARNNCRSADMFKNTIKPMSWMKPVYELDPNNWDNNGYENEDLIVWMRTAAFPTFRKLYRRVNHEKPGYISGLEKGSYILRVIYNYPVKSFGGGKRFIISTTSFLGGKNNFLGIAYIAVGSICLLLGTIFLIIHIKYGKKPADLQNITQNTPFSD